MEVREFVAKRKLELKEEVSSLSRKPKLVIIQVNDDPASDAYIRGKLKDGAEIGADCVLDKMDPSTSEETLLSRIEEYNQDPAVDGLIVQLPLPKHISEDKVKLAVSPKKDVDGFHPLGKQNPCTPKGIIRMLDEAGVEIKGKRAVVIGRSQIVGLPVAKLLLDRNATVTICHSRTKDLGAVTREAEILVVAIGRPKFVTADMVSPGTVVIDVGVNRDPETGKLVGDVDFEAIEPKASVITPVPGGVGPMTIACLMENTIECFLRKKQG
jgi:methylenetetrahydrofolate dehydrogenase (NADP+)/methenyltetrahydrofolate cyclohydrolase